MVCMAIIILIAFVPAGMALETLPLKGTQNLSSFNINHTYIDPDIIPSGITPTKTATIGPIIPGSTNLKVNVTTSPAEIDPGSQSTVTVTVKASSDNTPVSGVSVTLTVSGGTLDASSGTTNAQGQFTTAFKSTSSGTYNVTAKALKTGYSEATGTGKVTVRNTAPIASFSFSQQSPSDPLTITFDASGVSDIDGTVASIVWDFGDGETGIGKEATHTYQKDGNYNVVLTVKDNQGATTTYNKFVSVQAPAGLGTTELMIIGALAVILIIIAAIAAFLLMSESLQVVPKGPSAPADGKSSIPVKVQFVNRLGQARRMKFEREVEMEATSGKIQKAVIPAGKDYAETVLTSSNECGDVTINAKSGGKTGSAKVVFTGNDAGLDVSINPGEIQADGKSMATVTIKVRDAGGYHTASLKERAVELKTSLGNIDSVVKIPPKAMEGKATLVSSPVDGVAVVTATMGSVRGEGRLVFKGMPKRYCMHCGSPMELQAAVCSACQREPPSDIDTKLCPNCATVLPMSAKFCNHCGAKQPEKSDGVKAII